MRLLVLGGTVFLGRHVVTLALRRGHDVTLFHRGRHYPGLFPNAESLIGDRDGGLDPLRGREWDAVIDTSGYFPRIVGQSTELLASSVGYYLFVSSISVYRDLGATGIDETAPTGRLEDESVEEITGETYGPLKALCEEAVAARFPGRSSLVRPGLIVGPDDPSDRFTYWVERIAAGGDLLVPGVPERPVQVIDVRDLALWMVELAERREIGVYNATGPDRIMTFGEMVETTRAASGGDARFVWVAEQFLKEHGVVPWTELPVWVPDDPDAQGLFKVDCARAFAAGLSSRPLDQTVRDTLLWVRSQPVDRKRRAGLGRDREAELLRLWRERSRPVQTRPS